MPNKIIHFESDDKYRFIRPIDVSIEIDKDGEYMTGHKETNTWGWGDTEKEALSGLRDDLIETFQILFNNCDYGLSEDLRANKKAIMEIVDYV